MKYRLQSRRKYFYNCPICALVYITAKALKAHYAALHPNLPCEVDELATGKSVWQNVNRQSFDTSLILTEPMDEDERFEEFCENTSNNYLIKDDQPRSTDLFSLPKAQVITVPPELSTSATASVGTTTMINEVVDYVPANRLITLTAPMDSSTVSFHPQPFQLTTTGNNNITPIFIKLDSNEILQHNGQIPKQATIITDVQHPVLMEQHPTSQQDINTSALLQQQQQQQQQKRKSKKVAASIENDNNNNDNMNSNYSHKNEKKYNCEACGKYFSTIYNKRRHDDMFHNNKIETASEFKCTSCDKVFTSIYNKTRHENVHKPINERLKYKCVINECNRGFTTQFILKMHIKKVHHMDVNF